MASRLQDVHLRGTAALKPLATTVAPGTLYFSTDTNVIERCADDGLTWQTYSGSGGGGGGGSTISTGSEASKPATPATGDLYLPNDGIYLHRYNGTVWAPWGPIFPMTPPVDSDFTWVNQGVSTVNTTNGGIYLATAADTGAQNYHMRVQSAGATPYTITAAFLSNMVGAAGMAYGLFFRDSASGKLHSYIVVYSSGWLLAGQTLPTPTSFSGTYFTFPFVPTLIWLRITDNGTNRICSYSFDGQHFNVVHTISRTDFLTADQVGFGMNTSSNVNPAGVTLLHWKKT